MKKIRKVFFADKYYPSNHVILLDVLMNYYIEVDKYVNFLSFKKITPRVIYVPYGNYISCGLVSIAGYKVFQLNNRINTLILVSFLKDEKNYFCYLSDYDAFNSPLGIIKLNKNLQKIFFKGLKFSKIDNNIFNKDYSIEMQIPYIKLFLSVNDIIPIILSRNYDINLFINFLIDFLKLNTNVGLVIMDNLEKDSDLIFKIKYGNYSGESLSLKLLLELSSKLFLRKDILIYINSNKSLVFEDEKVGYMSALLFS